MTTCTPSASTGCSNHLGGNNTSTIPLIIRGDIGLISRLTYASPAWYGYLNKNSLNKIQGVINRFKRYGYLPANQEDFSVICEIADNRLFNTVLNNRNHVLHQLLPPVKLTPYDLRTRSHNHSLPRADNNRRKNFIYRLLYKNIY